MRTTEPLFSIVSISYQNLDGLRETVESVGAQSFTDYEHIVIDGGSSDGTGDWLAENFTGTWVSEPDGGRYPAMNKGALRAAGKYLWFLHAGDSFGDPEVLSRVAAAIAAQDAPPDWLYGLARVVAPDKRVIGTLGYVPFTMFNFGILQKPLPHQATAIARELFWELGGYALDVPVAADQVLLMSAANRSDPLALADFLCDFDATGISANRSWSDNLRDDIVVLRTLNRPVTRWRSTDMALALGYSAFRNGARALRDVSLKSVTN